MKASIGQGLLVLLGVAADDHPGDAAWLARKIAQLRIFADGEGLMNRDVRETAGDIMVISQFTLHAAYKKGNRPSFMAAARPEQAVPLYELFVNELSALIHKPVATGSFGADMKVALVNDGPVTITMDSKHPQ